MKIRDIKNGETINPFASDFNDDELLNIAKGGGGERMGTRMLAAELLSLRQAVSGLARAYREHGEEEVSDVITTILDVYMLEDDFGPRHDAGEYV